MLIFSDKMHTRRFATLEYCFLPGISLRNVFAHHPFWPFFWGGGVSLWLAVSPVFILPRCARLFSGSTDNIFIRKKSPLNDEMRAKTDFGKFQVIKSPFGTTIYYKSYKISVFQIIFVLYQRISFWALRFHFSKKSTKFSTKFSSIFTGLMQNYLFTRFFSTTFAHVNSLTLLSMRSIDPRALGSRLTTTTPGAKTGRTCSTGGPATRCRWSAPPSRSAWVCWRRSFVYRGAFRGWGLLNRKLDLFVKGLTEIQGLWHLFCLLGTSSQQSDFFSNPAEKIFPQSETNQLKHRLLFNVGTPPPLQGGSRGTHPPPSSSGGGGEIPDPAGSRLKSASNFPFLTHYLYIPWEPPFFFVATKQGCSMKATIWMCFLREQ